MIRGIILLILSCVVLTLQTNPYPCSCETTPGSAIYDEARDAYPMPNVDKVDMTQLPKDGSDIERFYNTYSQEQYLAETDTSAIEGILSGVLGDCSLVERLLVFLTEVLANVKIEIKALELFIQVRLENLCIAVSGINSPLLAHNHMLDVLKLLSRKRYADRCEEYLTVRKDLEDKYSGLLTDQAAILRKSVSFSKGLDDRVSHCQGGLLGGLLCGKLDILNGLVEGVLYTLLETVFNLLNNLKISLDAYVIDLKATLDVHIGTFSKLSDDDITENMVAYEIKQNYAQLENNEPVTGDLIKERLEKYVSDERRMKTLQDIIAFHLQLGYTFSDSEFTCSGLELGLLSPITCQLAGTLGVLNGLDVQLDIRAGGDLLRSVIKTILLSVTGSPFCEATVISIDVNGAIQINAVIDIALVERLLVPVYGLTNFIGSINTLEVGQSVSTILDIVNSVTDVNAIITHMNEENQKKIDIVNEVTQSAPDALTLLKSREDAASLQDAQINAAVDAINRAGGINEVAEVVNQRVIDYKSSELDDYKATLASIQNDAKQAEARVASCTENFYQAKLDHMNEPDNAEYTQAYEQRSAELKDALELSLKVKQQCDDLQAKLELTIDLRDKELIELQAKLQLCLSDLLSGVTHTIESLKLRITLHPEEILDLLRDVLKAIFGVDCNILDALWFGLDTTDPLGLDLIFEDSVLTDLLDPITQCHRTLLPSVIELLTGSRVQSCDFTPIGQPEKRDLSAQVLLKTLVHIQLEVESGDVHVKRDWQVVPEEISSSSSLGVSFILAIWMISCVLCFF